MLAKADPKAETSLDGGKPTYVASGKLSDGSVYHFLNWPSPQAIAEFQAGLISLGETLGDEDGAGYGSGQGKGKGGKAS